MTLTCSDPSLPTDGDNLVVRAAHALSAWAGEQLEVPPAARLHLDKCVPYGAGLGGGSSDAAAALRLLADLWALDVPQAKLHRLAADLGSDVPFFLDEGPAVATGRGEVLTPLVHPDGTPYTCPFWIVVAVPPVQVSTPAAYALVTPHGTNRPDLAAVVASNDLARWRRDLVNDFQVLIEAAYPQIGPVREALAMAGAGYTSLSGSGSAVFGVYEREAEAHAGASNVGDQGAQVWVDPPAGAKV